MARKAPKKKSKPLSVPSMNQTIVDFANPPVHEVVCGMGFPLIQGFQSPHMGLFWSTIIDAFPDAEVQPPLMSPITHTIELGDLSDVVRHFYRNKERTEVVQLQQGRFLYNWIKATNETAYPRYPAVVLRFLELRDRFHEFLRARNLPLPVVNELRLEYVNHILQDGTWETPGDIHKVFPDFRYRTKGRKYIKPPRSWNMSSRHPVNHPDSQMTITMRTGARLGNNGETEQIILAQLSVIGRVADPDDQGIKDWFNMARQAINLTFVDITSPDLQKRVWKAV